MGKEIVVKNGRCQLPLVEIPLVLKWGPVHPYTKLSDGIYDSDSLDVVISGGNDGFYDGDYVLIEKL